MPSLKEVKNRITSVKSTQQITKAMKMVAAAKLRRAQDRIMQIRPYSDRLKRIIGNVSSAENDLINNYAIAREVGSVVVVVITSDRGLCGAFNMNVNKSAYRFIQEEFPHIQDSIRIMPIGKKAYDFFKNKDYVLIDDFYELFQNLDFEHVKEAAEYVMSGYVEGSYDRIVIIYNEFKNVATQIIRAEDLLPITQDDTDATVNTNEIEYIFEPSKEFVFNELVPKSLKIQFYKAVLESNAAEQGARMTAMDQATDNASEILKELKLTYNRTRQAAITKELNEIVSGADALKAN